MWGIVACQGEQFRIPESIREYAACLCDATSALRDAGIPCELSSDDGGFRCESILAGGRILILSEEGAPAGMLIASVFDAETGDDEEIGSPFPAADVVSNVRATLGRFPL